MLHPTSSRRRRRIVTGSVLVMLAALSLGVAGAGGMTVPGAGVVPASEVSTPAMPSPSAPSMPPATVPVTSGPPSSAAPPRTALKPGTNHNWEAERYAYPAKDVQRWINEPEQKAGQPKRKVAFLTFDDGPTYSSTPQVLTILRAKKVPATFFYMGRRQALRAGDDQLPQRTIAQGHAIAIHGYSHDYDYLYPGGTANPQHVLGDHQRAVEAVRRAVGKDFVSHAYRYPGGHMSWKGLRPADRGLAKRGAHWIDWNAMDGDGDLKPPTSADAAARMVRSHLAARGNPTVAVVLLHDYPHNRLTIRSLPKIIDDLTDAGYEFGVIA
ncbi:polysaccharide deacetylase family protein [Propionibacteriaceae bacterium Y1700]|uniref:polysaccharide deacetylase family protein n=1 Tax=Microlunatus sp. Y1700 TaxID=3418487 RepID=UPI003DA6D5D8